MNFCEQCGQKLSAGARFCPKCGYQINIASEASNPKNIDVDIPVPENYHKKLNRDLKAPNILTYKHNMGLDTGIENVFIGQVADMKKMLISVCWAMLSIKFFIFSFEDEGIVMLGLDEFGFFNGKNIFIPQAEIQNIKFRHGMLRRVLQFTVRNETSKFYLPNLVLGSPYQKENLNNLQSIIDKY